MGNNSKTGAGGASFDRRIFLGGALAAGAGVLAAACGSSGTVSKAATTLPAGSDLGAIEHVVFLMQENRLFDHDFGAYKGVRGFGDHPAGDLGAFSQPFPGHTSPTPAGCQLPFHLDVATGPRGVHPRPEPRLVPPTLVPGQRVDGRLRHDPYVDPVRRPDQRAHHHGVPHPGRHPLPLRTGRCLHHLRRLSRSIMGPTHPNRLMSISGTIDPAGTHGGPVVITNPLPEARFSVNWPTMPEVLEDAGVSWKVYSPPGRRLPGGVPHGHAVSDAILPYFSQYSKPTSALYQKAFVPTFPTTSPRMSKAGTCPRCRGSSRPSATTSTRRLRPPSGRGSSTRRSRP